MAQKYSLTRRASLPGIANYATYDELPLTNVTVGRLAWVASSQKLYVFDGAWQSIDTTNLPPTLTALPASISIPVAAEYTLDLDTVASDPDGLRLTYSVDISTPPTDVDTIVEIDTQGNLVIIPGLTPESFIIEVTADDGIEQDSKFVTVTTINTAPIIDTIPTQYPIYNPSAAYRVPLSFTDVDLNDSVTWNIVSTSGIDAGQCEISPENDALLVTVNVTDPFTVTVEAQQYSASPSAVINFTVVADVPTGQEIFGHTTTTWTVPQGVTEISAVAVGSGGGAYIRIQGFSFDNVVKSGGGGALSYSSSISVTPGETLDIINNTTGYGIYRDGTKLLYAESGASASQDFVDAGGIGGRASQGVGEVCWSGGNGWSKYMINFRVPDEAAAGGGAPAGYDGDGWGGEDGNDGFDPNIRGSDYLPSPGTTAQLENATPLDRMTGPGGIGIKGLEGQSFTTTRPNSNAQPVYFQAGGAGGEDGYLGGTVPSSGIFISNNRGLYGGAYGAGGGITNRAGTVSTSSGLFLSSGRHGAVRIIFGPGRAYPGTATADRDPSAVFTTPVINETIRPGEVKVFQTNAVHPDGFSVSYSAYPYTGRITSDNISIDESTGELTVTGIEDSSDEEYQVIIVAEATNGALVGQIATFIPIVPAGQQEFTTPGTYSLTVPEGVYTMSAVAVGGGGGGAGAYDYDGTVVDAMGDGGGGGALSYIINRSVTPGESLTVTVGSGGAGGPRITQNIGYHETMGDSGNPSGIYRGATPLLLAAGGEQGGYGFPAYPQQGRGGSASNGVGDARYSGGGSRDAATDLGDNDNDYLNSSTGGGGAAGYAGNGGTGGTNSATYPASNGSGGSAGGGYGGGPNRGGGGGGGTGIYGQGTNGTFTYTAGAGGTGGSSGADGVSVTSGTGGNGGFPGGGGGGGAYGGVGGGRGGNGAVRVLWGPSRAYPSTNTTDQGISITSTDTYSETQGQTLSFTVTVDNPASATVTLTAEPLTSRITNNDITINGLDVDIDLPFDNNTADHVIRLVVETNTGYKDYQDITITPIVPVGQDLFETDGVFTVPDGVNNISVVGIGSGGAAGFGQYFASGGGGGALAYTNNISVSPGDTFTVTVNNGFGDSIFVRDSDLTTLVQAYGGGNASNTSTRAVDTTDYDALGGYGGDLNRGGGGIGDVVYRGGTGATQEFPAHGGNLSPRYYIPGGGAASYTHDGVHHNAAPNANPQLFTGTPSSGGKTIDVYTNTGGGGIGAAGIKDKVETPANAPGERSVYGGTDPVGIFPGKYGGGAGVIYEGEGTILQNPQDANNYFSGEYYDGSATSSPSNITQVRPNNGCVRVVYGPNRNFPNNAEDVFEDLDYVGTLSSSNTTYNEQYVYSLIAMNGDFAFKKNGAYLSVFRRNEAVWQHWRDYDLSIAQSSAMTTFADLLVYNQVDNDVATVKSTVFDFITEEFDVASTVTLTNVSTTNKGTRFGYRLSYDGEWLAVSDHTATVSGQSNAGAVYLYRRGSTPNNWTYVTEVTSPANTADAFFGGAVTVNNDWLIVSNIAGEGITNPNNGKVYVYQRTGTNTWGFFLELSSLAPLGYDSTKFGHICDTDVTSTTGDFAFDDWYNIYNGATTWGNDDLQWFAVPAGFDQHKIYMYKWESGTGLTYHSTIENPNIRPGYQTFGMTIAGNNDFFATGDTYSAGGTQQHDPSPVGGYIYFYKLVDNVWTLVNTRYEPSASYNGWGGRLAVSGNTVAATTSTPPNPLNPWPTTERVIGIYRIE